MKCPNPKCKNPGLIKLFLTNGATFDFCPVCGTPLNQHGDDQEDQKTNEPPLQSGQGTLATTPQGSQQNKGDKCTLPPNNETQSQQPILTDQLVTTDVSSVHVSQPVLHPNVHTLLQEVLDENGDSVLPPTEQLSQAEPSESRSAEFTPGRTLLPREKVVINEEYIESPTTSLVMIQGPEDDATETELPDLHISSQVKIEGQADENKGVVGNHHLPGATSEVYTSLAFDEDDIEIIPSINVVILSEDPDLEMGENSSNITDSFSMIDGKTNTIDELNSESAAVNAEGDAKMGSLDRMDSNNQTMLQQDPRGMKRPSEQTSQQDSTDSHLQKKTKQSDSGQFVSNWTDQRHSGCTDPRQNEPRENDPKQSEPRESDSRQSESRESDQRESDQRQSDPGKTDARQLSDPREGDLELIETLQSNLQRSVAKESVQQQTDPRQSDSKPSDPRQSDSKPSEQIYPKESVPMQIVQSEIDPKQSNVRQSDPKQSDPKNSDQNYNNQKQGIIRQNESEQSDEMRSNLRKHYAAESDSIESHQTHFEPTNLKQQPDRVSTGATDRTEGDQRGASDGDQCHEIKQTSEQVLLATEEENNATENDSIEANQSDLEPTNLEQQPARESTGTTDGAEGDQRGASDGDQCHGIKQTSEQVPLATEEGNNATENDSIEADQSDLEPTNLLKQQPFREITGATDGTEGDQGRALDGDQCPGTNQTTEQVPLATEEESDVSDSSDEGGLGEESTQTKGKIKLTKELKRQKKKERDNRRKPGKKTAKKSQKQKEEKDSLEKKNSTGNKEKKTGKGSSEVVSDDGQLSRIATQSASPPNPIGDWGEDCLTVIFHALLSPNFNFNPEKHSVHLMFGHGELGGWKSDSKDLEYVIIPKDNYVLLRGKVDIPVRLARPGTSLPYKYVVKSGDDYDWEYLEFKPAHKEIINRDLAVHEEYIKKDAVWHQYDGVIYPDPKSSFLATLGDWFTFLNFKTRDEPLRNRERAAFAFLPKWKGFVVDAETKEAMTVSQAFEQVWMNKTCMSVVFIQQYGSRRKRVINGFEFGKVLCELLKLKIHSNISMKPESLESKEARVDRLVSSLAIAYLIWNHKLKLDNAALMDLIHCLKVMPDGKGGCDFDDIYKDHPEEMWSTLVLAVLYVCKCATDKPYSSPCPDVLLAVPLVHFLRKECQPCQKPELDEAKNMEEWCHSKGLPDIGNHSKFVDKYLPLVQPMFEVDHFLRRVFLCTTPFKDFDTISSNYVFPVHEVCTALVWIIWRERFIYSERVTIQTCIEQMTKRLQVSPKYDQICSKEVIFIAKAASDLLNVILEKEGFKINELYTSATQLFAVTLGKLKRVEEGTKAMTTDHGRIGERAAEDIDGRSTAILVSVLDAVGSAVKKEFSHKISVSHGRQMDELKMWTTLLNIDFSHKDTEESWEREIVSLFTSRLKGLNDRNIVEMFCEVDMDKLHRALVDSITSEAFVVAERIIEKGRDEEPSMKALRDKSMRDGPSSKAGELLSRMLTRAWSKAMALKNPVTDYNTLQFLLSWKPWIGFLNFYGSLGSQMILSEDAQRLVERVVASLKRTQDSLENAKVHVKTLVVLEKHKDTFSQLCCAVSNIDKSIGDNRKKDDLTSVAGSKTQGQASHNLESVRNDLEKRSNELRAFQNLRDEMFTFIKLCSLNKDTAFVEISSLKSKSSIDVSQYEMVDLCTSVAASDEFPQGRIQVVFFDVPQEFLAMLPRLRVASDSTLFQGLWERHSKQAYSKRKSSNEMLQGGLTLKDVYGSVWMPANEEWEKLGRAVCDGCISLKEVDKHFDKYKERLEDAEKEMKIMLKALGKEPAEGHMIANWRVSQMMQYFNLQNYLDAAEIVWNFKNAVGLRGDFKVLAQLRDQTSVQFKTNRLDSIDYRFTKAAKSLEQISLESSHCLQAIIECKPLVRWLKETIRDTSALSTLVDLAMISAGENDLEVDRISHFHTSCLNFAPLIFDLTEEFSFDELMKACEPVWNAVKRDKHLPKKLAETNRHLEWLKAVKNSHGSVEMSSLTQAKSINSSGVYRVGCLLLELDANRNCLPVSDGRSALDGVLSLTLPIDQNPRDTRQRAGASAAEEEVELKTYNLNDLKDLQSKLMLIAGKTAQLQNKDCIESTEEISKFVEVLEGIMRLGKVYIDLCEAGDVKYLEWSEEFHCCDNKLSTRQSVRGELENLSHAMEERLKKWRTYVHTKRRHYRELNHFTTQQILVLRIELGTLRRARGASTESLPLPVYVLLESVLQGITSQDLNYALSGCSGFDLDDVGLYERGLISSGSKVPIGGSFRAGNARERYDSVFQQVEKMGYADPESTAVAALKACDVLNDDNVSEMDLISWCMDNGDDEDAIDVWMNEARNDKSYADFFPELQQEEELEEDLAEDRHVEDMTQISTEGEVSREEVCIEDTKDGAYLTLDELGALLARLAKQSVQPLNRKFPEYLKRDQPNLLLVPEGDILSTLLTLYMECGDNSLPTHNEVLICTPNTTAEEVELLWWRALGDTYQQLFCLVNADLLPYNVSQVAVNVLKVLVREFADIEPRLILLCGLENEDRSHLIAALDQYRVNATPGCAPTSVLAEYLRERFTCQSALDGYYRNERILWTPAAAIDNTNLSVSVVTSDRAGVGKSLVVTRLSESLSKLQNNKQMVQMAKEEGIQLPLCVTVPLHGAIADPSALLDSLWQSPVKVDLPISRVIHLDVSPSVLDGLDTVLFNLLVLGTLSDQQGRVWRRRSTDLYVIEITTGRSAKKSATKNVSGAPQNLFCSFLPTTNCLCPRETLQKLKSSSPAPPDNRTKNPLFDEREFRSEPVQRAYQYLQKCGQNQNLDRYHFISGQVMGTHAECLALLIKHCGIQDPSWSELKHFVDFLNSQLKDCEQSIFCNPDVVGDKWMEGTFVGFKTFVVRFMIHMSRDFATPSLGDAIVCTAGTSAEEEEDEDIRPLQIRRRWESSPHPYIFFNQDRITMTFLGFHINASGDLFDPDTRLIIEKCLMSKQLRQGLALQRVDFDTDYKSWSKKIKIEKLCSVMGVQWVYDPDTNYELTTDNMKKILAIHMRFRCGIPVVVMGETGCGKTRLIRYMCALQAGHDGPRNMLLMKVHGGTSYDDISKKVEQAEAMARENEKQGIDTVLFFDEANTTDALGMIKEVMVDRRINGRPVGVGLRRLHFIAACNPYRRHTDRMIKKLESAGLGYHVTSEETKEKLGKIPLRHLVYRVHALPASMCPLVWDFGQLKPQIEELYIRQIVRRYVLTERKIPGDQHLVNAIAIVLATSQKYMREQKDECSFVSLRDVERAMTVMTWFYQHHNILRPQATPRNVDDSDEEESDIELSNSDDSDDDDDDDKDIQPVDIVTWSLVLSLGVCYHAKLQKRSSYRKSVVAACHSPLTLGGQRQMYKEIFKCQKVVIDQLTLGSNIARNTALRENVFMMVVCIDLRIPLFVVGKPGSSKSLAKTVVADNMQGDASKSMLFKNFKRAHMVSYQCSPLSTPEGIVATFRQCRRLQENNPDGRYASVVVLDEVGLAEDSPLMPLKTLHPLLEDGVTSSDDVMEVDEKPTRVAFIGISNWSLDPAKMNRGLMLMRAEPSQKELEDSAWGICAEQEEVRVLVASLLDSLAAGYSELYRSQKQFRSLRDSKRDEFFGLRDFYSLVKMVYSIAAENKREPTWTELEHAIRRNFGGLDEIDAVEIFRNRMWTCVHDISQEFKTINTMDLIKASLDHRNTIGESRYLLVLTENYSALRIVEQHLIRNNDDYVVIFGSSFPKDQEFTQICRNINQIKVCMETGRTVILLNLESLYESLYDALNQYYVYCADQKYVDLGLGSHRVKCRVDDTFRLIVIAEKDVVYNKFPIPLINRLEKHYLVTSEGLTATQSEMVTDLEAWVKDFATVQYMPHEQQKQSFEIGDAFVGYHSDTIPSVVLQVCREMGHDGTGMDKNQYIEWGKQAMTRSQSLLLQCVTPDAVARLSRTRLLHQAESMWNMYFREQQHCSLSALLAHLLNCETQDDVEKRRAGLMVQVTTHSRLLSENDMTDICAAIGFKRLDVEHLTLQQFQTEQQFSKRIREFFVSLSANEGVLLVQCDSGDDNFNLIACARHVIMDQRLKRAEMLVEKLKVKDVPPIHLVVVVQLPRIKGGCKNFVGFQGGKWDSVHIDDLRPPTDEIPPIECLIDRSISDLLKPEPRANDPQGDRVVPMDIDETLWAKDTEESMDHSSHEEVMCVDTTLRDQPGLEEGIVAAQMVTGQAGPEEVPTQTRVNAVALLRRSIQAAAGRLEDDPIMMKRATHRIELFLKLLPEDSPSRLDGQTFARILNEKIYKLLVERDEKRAGTLSRNWVRTEALSGTSMHERGTFRKALQYRVSCEVVPLLSKVLAYVDRDCNLDLMRDDQSWISRLWICIFENERISEIYCDMSTITFSDTTREHIPISGRGGHPFRCRFPFSWVIKELIEELWRGASDVSARGRGTEEEKLRKILENSELRHILDIIRGEGNEDEAVKRYLHDFVHMVYKPAAKDHIHEIEFVCSAIVTAARIRGGEEFRLDFAAVHVTHSHIQARLSNFNQLVKKQPDIIDELVRQRYHEQAELTLDVTALLMFLESLEPTLKDVEDHGSRSQWCTRVMEVRQTIETMTSKENFTQNTEQGGGYGDRTKELMKQCWMMWQRLGVVRLFIDHVCIAGDLMNAANTANVQRLWKVLGEETDLMKNRCVHGLERFLVECSRDVSRRNNCSEDMSCPVCMHDCNTPSMTPCGHYCCLECAMRWFNDNTTCPTCRQQVPSDFEPKEDQQIRGSLDKVKEFRRHCNAFFMEVVSVFCFGYSPCGTLEEDTFITLMGYATREGSATKTFSPFPDYGIDATPVVRLFLLQQLLKSGEKKLKEHLDRFITDAWGVVGNVERMIEVFVLCVQCMEDALYSTFVKRAAELPLEHKLRLIERNCKDASKLFSQGGGVDGHRQVDVRVLEAIATTRFVLSEVAEYMYLSQTESNMLWSHPNVSRALDQLFNEVPKICLDTLVHTPRVFLLKQLSRRFGVESIKILAKKKGLEWILPADASTSVEVAPDRFLVYGAKYQSLRETISRAAISGDVTEVNDELRNMACDVTNVVFQLGVYQEITTNQRVISQAVQNNLRGFVQRTRHISDQSRVLMVDLVAEAHLQGITTVFNLARGSSSDRSIVEIVVHLAAVLFSQDNNSPAAPLVSLALHPATMANSFLPTMPDDPFQEIRSSVTGSEQFYECPNGHPYLIGECGRPNQEYKCTVCGANIGGTNHRLVEGNRPARATDLTNKGHFIGPARERAVTPERSMSAALTSLVRLLLHGSMLVGSCYHPQDVAQLITPAIPVETVQTFLWDHIISDMRLLAQTSGRSVDDTALTVHLVLQNIAEHAHTHQDDYNVLTAKGTRAHWEVVFTRIVLSPVLSNLDASIQRSLEVIANDTRFGADPLLRQLYELEAGVDEYTEGIHPGCTALWRYRTRVTLDHVTRTFQESQTDDHVILGEFLKQEHKVRAVRFLPDVVKLQRLLMDRYHRSLDSTETEKLKLKEFYKRFPPGVVKEYKSLVRSFSSAWNILVATLTEQGTTGVLKNLIQNKVNEDSPVAMLIPASSGRGTCSLVLVRFLVGSHNELLQLYHRQVNIDSSEVNHVPLTEVTGSQLVSYDVDRDLLPLILAHCHYSLEVGRGTCVEYDWSALQRQLVDRLIRGRVLVHFKENDYIKTAEVSADSVLISLRTKIPQVSLSIAIQNQIVRQYRTLQDISEALSSLNIAITFLASGGGKADMLVSTFMHRVLSMPNDAGLRNAKAKDVCQLQHVVSLWRLLSIERAKILTRLGQDPFEHLPAEFKEHLDEGSALALNNVLRRMNESSLDVFVSQLLEIIILQLNESHDISKDTSLKEYIPWILEEKRVDPIPGIDEFPVGVQMRHIVRMWQIVVGMSDKYHERRAEATG